MLQREGKTHFCPHGHKDLKCAQTEATLSRQNGSSLVINGGMIDRE